MPVSRIEHLARPAQNSSDNAKRSIPLQKDMSAKSFVYSSGQLNCSAAAIFEPTQTIEITHIRHWRDLGAHDRHDLHNPLFFAMIAQHATALVQAIHRFY